MLAELVKDYFAALARRFPVMSASDEFHFLPRSQAAAEYYDRLDDLSETAVKESIEGLKEFRDRFKEFSSVENDLDQSIDLELLQASVDSALIEFEKNRTWLHNPLLYLKIAFIGLDHAITKPADDERQKQERLASRLDAVPRLLKQAAANIVSIPESYHQAATDMTRDCSHYLKEISKGFIGGSIPILSTGLQECLRAITQFTEFLSSFAAVPDKDFAAGNLDIILRERFLSKRSLDEIFQIAADEWAHNLSQLQKLQATIDPSKHWQEIYHSYVPMNVELLDTVDLYRREITNLHRFFQQNGFSENITHDLPELCETPAYLRSVRSSASFSAAFSKDHRERDYFYITTQPKLLQNEDSTVLLKRRLHREYKFLTAHETFPGHYLLDSTRRQLANPVRSQIESALFYEGWAYYVESLLTEYGYVQSPLDLLVDHKRRLWRAARCQIDVGLASGKLSTGDALDLLMKAGFSKEEATGQIDRFRLNPGYQLCYSVGRFELTQLRNIYGSRLGLDRFHSEILEAGQLPFHLMNKRFEAIEMKRKTSERNET